MQGGDGGGGAPPNAKTGGGATAGAPNVAVVAARTVGYVGLALVVYTLVLIFLLVALAAAPEVYVPVRTNEFPV